MEMIHEKVNICEKYNIETYISSMGLAVNSKYRGLGLSQRLLETRYLNYSIYNLIYSYLQCSHFCYRKLLAKPFGFKLTNTVFTSDFSNRNADKAGFQLDLEFTYDEIKKIFPEIELGDINAKKISMKTLLFNP